MNQEFVDAYHHLNVNNKRDKLNRELLIIGEYIKEIEGNLGMTNEVDIFNYNPNQDQNMTEDDFLTSTYQDIFNVERELITIAKLTKKNEKDEMFDE